MDEFRGIRVVATGKKYQTEQGFTAIKNGVKARDAERAEAAVAQSADPERRALREAP